MSYDLIKAGMKGIIEVLGLAPANQVINFEIASPNTFGKTYTMFPEDGDMGGEEKESLHDRVYDKQDWIIQIAYNRGTHSSIIDLDELHRKREEVINAVDDPANWTSFTRMLNVVEWDVETLEHYFVLNIKVEITDTITY